MRFLFFATFLLLLIGGWADVRALLYPTTPTSGSAVESYSARTDFAVIAPPTPLPSMGGARGVGNRILDPDFNSAIYRLTDIDTVRNTRYAPQQEWHMSCGGWGDWRVSNKDSTKIFICNGGGGTLLLPFDPSTGKPGAAKELPRGVAGYPEWSKTQKDAAFGLAASRDPEIVRLDFSLSSSKVTPVVNLAKVPNCAQQFSGSAMWTELSVDWRDATFAMAVGNGFQGSAHMVYVWNAQSGCQTYDTEAETVNGSPVTGTRDSFFAHSVKISGDGKVVMVGPSGSNHLRHFWHVGTAEVDTMESNVNYGHFALGYDSFLNMAGLTSDGKWCKLGMATRLLTALSAANYLLTSKQCADTLPRGDNHASWNNDDPTDRQPFATSTVTIPFGSPITAPWQNEILVFMQDGTVHREAHTFNSGNSKFFACQNAIGSVSQDGKWFFFSSDWEGTLGKDNGGNLRCDDFAVELH
jgi:hypothetical protein